MPRLRFAAALDSLRGTTWQIGLLSGVINVLALTSSFFMLQVYDRVLPSGSLPTLVVLCLLAAGLFAIQGALELIRSRVLSHIGLALDQKLGRRVYEALMQVPLKMATPGDALQPVRDLDQVRTFLASPGPTALFDLPWMPIYLGICFVFHFWIGIAALCGAVLLIALTIIAEIKARTPSRELAALASRRNAIAEASRRNADAVRAMGFSGPVADRWLDANRSYLKVQLGASNTSGLLSTISRMSRMALQSAMLAIGAVLVIQGEASGGIMIASSIMLSRALAPVELATANWRSFVAARQGWTRLVELLGLFPEDAERLALPRPQLGLAVQSITVVPPGARAPSVADVSFELTKGAGLGIIGPSASGKSSLVRALVGVWTPLRGVVRLDGATLQQWEPDRLGASLGYVPQDVSLFAGTVAENISRLMPGGTSEAIVQAAKQAGVHEMIVRLPDGYETQIGENGAALSAGQRQRIALARALFGEPFLVVMDEPNSNLDSAGDQALASAIAGVRARGGIAIIVAHRPSALVSVDQVLVMSHGRVQAFGPKDEVLKTTTKNPAAPLKVISPVGINNG